MTGISPSDRDAEKARRLALRDASERLAALLYGYPPGDNAAARCCEREPVRRRRYTPGPSPGLLNRCEEKVAKLTSLPNGPVPQSAEPARQSPHPLIAGAAMTLQDDHYFEPQPGQTDLIEYLAELPPAAPARPVLVPSYAAIAAIAEPVLGPRWDGKLAPEISELPRQVLRWRAGEARPTERTMIRVRGWALRTARHLLASVGETDLAVEVQAVIDRDNAAAKERGRALFAQRHGAALAEAVG